MPTILEMVDNVVLRLGDPRANRPNVSQVLNQVCTQVRTVLRHNRNTSNPWNLNDTVITVVPNEATYQITVANFGTPLAVLSYDPTNVAWVPRLIEIFQPQNTNYDWGFAQNMAGAFIPYDGSQCTAQRCAFHWKNNIPYIEFNPLPLLTCQYKIRFLVSANGVGDMALAQSPLQSEDCDLVEVRAALALLAITEWEDPMTNQGRAANAEKRRDLSQTLQGEEAELRRQFEAGALITTGPRIKDRWNPCVG